MTVQTAVHTGIAPPREHLELGARIRYHHRCAVARWQTGKKKSSTHDAFGRDLFSHANPPPNFEPYWRLFEGADISAYTMNGWLTEADLAQKMPYNGRRNKTLFMWPEEGEGIVIGLVRRGIGESVSGYMTSSTPDSGSEYEPGYFAEEFWVWVYAVKRHLSGTDYILVPMDAVLPLHFGRTLAAEAVE